MHQRRDPGSLLNWMAKIIAVRKECREIGWGDWELLRTGSPQVLGMCYSWRGTSRASSSQFQLASRVRDPICVSMAKAAIARDLLDTSDSRAQCDGEHQIVLEAYGYRWYRVGGLNYAFAREQ